MKTVRRKLAERSLWIAVGLALIAWVVGSAGEEYSSFTKEMLSGG